MTKNEEMDVLMAMLLAEALNGKKEDSTITPYTAEIRISPENFSCVTKTNKIFIGELGKAGIEWFDETNNRLEPIMREQSLKLCEILKEKFDINSRRR